MQGSESNRAAAQYAVKTFDRRKLLVRGTLAGAILLALAGAYLGGGSKAMATLPSSPVHTAGVAKLPSFAEIAERVTPAVVNVAVTQAATAGVHPHAGMPQLPKEGPFGEFFQRFFHDGIPFRGGSGVPGNLQAQGSGFIIDPEGHIVTNNHVVEDATEVTVLLNDGTRYTAQVKGRDSKTDLALLKIDADAPLPYLELAGSDQARVGDWVLAVGNPFGLGGSVSAGIISARGRDIRSGPYDDYIQIDAPINRGNSGGPLFDASGRVIGVNTAIYSPSGGNVGIGFAIPSSNVKTVISSLKAYGRVERGWLGVQIQAVTDEIAAALGRGDRQGALVAEVVDDSPAAKGGLRAGDLILSVDRTPVTELKDLPRMVAEMQPGTKVEVAVARNGTDLALSLVLGEMPSDEPVIASAPTEAVEGEPRLGIYLAPLTPDAREAQGLDAQTQGVLVSRVEKDSAAEKAGIRAGSLITMVGSHPVGTPEEAANRVREAIGDGNQTVLLRIQENGRGRFLAVAPAA
jgi:serine protease Do